MFFLIRFPREVVKKGVRVSGSSNNRFPNLNGKGGEAHAVRFRVGYVENMLH